MNPSLRPTLSPTRGLTLVELLAALTIMSMFVGAVGGWCVSVAKTQRTITATSEAATPLDRALAALERDIDEAAQIEKAVRFDPAAGEIAIVTSHGLPGAGGRAVGWQEVVWKLRRERLPLLRNAPGAVEGETALVRSERNLGDAGADQTEQSRVILRGVLSFDIAAIPAREPPTQGVTQVRAPRVAIAPRIRGYELTVEMESGQRRTRRWEATP